MHYGEEVRAHRLNTHPRISNHHLFPSHHRPHRHRQRRSHHPQTAAVRALRLAGARPTSPTVPTTPPSASAASPSSSSSRSATRWPRPTPPTAGARRAPRPSGPRWWRQRGPPLGGNGWGSGRAGGVAPGLLFWPRVSRVSARDPDWSHPTTIAGCFSTSHFSRLPWGLRSSPFFIKALIKEAPICPVGSATRAVPRSMRALVPHLRQ